MQIAVLHHGAKVPDDLYLGKYAKFRTRTPKQHLPNKQKSYILVGLGGSREDRSSGDRIRERRPRLCMIKVKPRPGEPVQAMMRRLKKMCEREGVLREMKRTAYYEKPSDRNRRNFRKAKRRLQKTSEVGR
jgi:small subunit ribosomal protein S21